MKGTYKPRTTTSIGTADPCAACPHFAKCQKEQLACNQYAHWADFGGKTWNRQDRNPTRAIYERIYKRQAA